MSNDEKGRRAAILDAAGETFIRFGFKKTSMDDVARAAGLSRQGVYLHFPTKEELFREVVRHLVNKTRTAGAAALDRSDVELEDRLLDSFEAMYGSALDDAGSTNLGELFETAKSLVEDVVKSLDDETLADLTRVIRKDPIAARWRKLGISARALAEHLYAFSNGLKYRGTAREEYRDRMRIAIRIVCRGA